MGRRTAIDPAIVEAKVELAMGYLGGMVIAGSIYLGDELGLYRSLDGRGPVTSAEFAAITGLNERWLREWLEGQAAAGLLEYRGEGRFELTPELALVLVDESNPASVIGGFHDLPGQAAVLRHLRETFRTGIGLTYDQAGDAATIATERLLGPWHRSVLVSHVIPLLGMVQRLEAGALVIDVGCGGGVATVALARAFPRSEFHGYDISKVGLQRAEARARDAGAENVQFHQADVDPLPARGDVDLALTLDVLHDMAHPDRAATAIRSALKPDGSWFIMEMAAGESFEENLVNPAAAMLYGFSLQTCLSSSCSDPGGMALGTLGLPQAKLEALTREAGFTRFERLPLEHPFNAYYHVRP